MFSSALDVLFFRVVLSFGGWGGSFFMFWGSIHVTTHNTREPQPAPLDSPRASFVNDLSKQDQNSATCGGVVAE